MRESKIASSAVLGLLLGLGLIGSAYILNNSMKYYIKSQNTVHVKGLAEKIVPANLAIWPIKFQNVANDLQALESRISKDRDLVLKFLASHGFSKDDITFTIPQISDAEANQYSSGTKKAYRYSAESIISLRTSKVDAVKEASAQSNDLLNLST